MKKLITYAAILSLFSNAASANWELTTGEDPMTDEKAAMIGAGNEDGTIGLMFKCWDDNEQTRWIALVTDEEFDAAASYKKIHQLRVRIDKGQVQTLPFVLTDFNNKIGFIIGLDAGESFRNFQKELLNAKGKIVVDLNSFAITFNLSNTIEPVRKLIDTCKLNVTS